MRLLIDIAEDIKEAKKEKKQVKKEFGKKSHEYIDAYERLQVLKEEYDFRSLYE